MAKCPKCRGDNCETCGGPVVCTSHCYCQAIKIGQTDHVVCCKCGDRVASFAGQVRPWPIPYIPYYPTPYVYPGWNQPLITYGVSSGTSIFTGPQTIRANSASALDCTPQLSVGVQQ